MLPWVPVVCWATAWQEEVGGTRHWEENYINGTVVPESQFSFCCKQILENRSKGMKVKDEGRLWMHMYMCELGVCLSFRKEEKASPYPKCISSKQIPKINMLSVCTCCGYSSHSSPFFICNSWPFCSVYISDQVIVLKPAGKIIGHSACTKDEEPKQWRKRLGLRWWRRVEVKCYNFSKFIIGKQDKWVNSAK